MQNLKGSVTLNGRASYIPRYACSRSAYLRTPICAHAAASEGDRFSMPAAPVLLPEGDWSTVPGSVTAPKGFKASGLHSGMRAGSKADLALVVCEGGAVTAGVFTLNVMCAAPVTVTKKTLAANAHDIKAVLTNAGQANAATGDEGFADAQASQKACATALGCTPDEVLLMSTGVIGRRIKLDAMKAALPGLVSHLATDAESARRAAVAITTTDLVTKSSALELDLGGVAITMGGFCKGSGMIHPNMATMLGLVTCDAAVEQSAWSQMLQTAVKRSFNVITVDGDTSTNDTVLAMASGAAGNEPVTDASSPAGQKLQAALTGLLQGMAKAIAWDGEGATCLIEVRAAGASSEEDALLVAKSVAASSLTKAAIFGHDPNWGRIACAAGYSGAKFDPDMLGVKLGPHVLMKNGQPLDFDRAAASAYLSEETCRHGTVLIDVSIGGGPFSGMAWGCDLSYDYVKINAEYTT